MRDEVGEEAFAREEEGKGGGIVGRLCPRPKGKGPCGELGGGFFWDEKGAVGAVGKGGGGGKERENEMGNETGGARLTFLYHRFWTHGDCTGVRAKRKHGALSLGFISKSG